MPAMFVKHNHFSRRKFFTLIPSVGIVIYVVLYFIATLLYAGGSQLNKNSVGFSWLNNYWCNLLNLQAINGQINAARPVAIAAMVVLCFSLILFWYIFPQYAGLKKMGTHIIQFSGAAAMITALFLLSGFHDAAINIASLFGLIAITGTFVGLHKLKWKKLFWMGMLIPFLVAINNIFYYDSDLIKWLPLVQKITFLFVLAWVGLTDYKIYKTSGGYLPAQQ